MSGRKVHRVQVAPNFSNTMEARTDRPDKPNPESGSGERNLDCGHYGACLDWAVCEQWESFNCKRCKLKNQVGFCR
jgi:hypothetical protein